MKVFISADIEGITSTTVWKETHSDQAVYTAHAAQMTREVLAACRGAIAAGADEIVVKDAHGPATNLDVFQMPKEVTLIRGWDGHPYGMVRGLDETFDAALFIGYHSAAGICGSPLSHTMSGKPHTVRINGERASEFMIYSYAAALSGVPTVFLSGDKALCEASLPLHPSLKTVAVKDGIGAMTISMAPDRAVDLIEKTVEEALKQDLEAAKITLPTVFDVEICYKEQTDAIKLQYFPGVELVDDTTLRFTATDYFEVLRTLWFLL